MRVSIKTLHSGKLMRNQRIKFVNFRHAGPQYSSINREGQPPPIGTLHLTTYLRTAPFLSG